jgi:hypothetical protein
MIDVSIATQKANAAKLEFDNASFGPAGFCRTRKQPVSLSDRQRRTIEQFAELVPQERRSAYHSAVLARLSGFPGDGAVFAACRGAADGFISVDVLVEHDLVQHKDYEKKWRSNAVTGQGRGR